ncbi:hypothetical protein HYH03_009548 [Edaphochlamys debaryana]|uniref:Defective in cullin neddylation protein n=1 Tax=Edaphochlamys debaryana TaxID=47281 RepID=A0A835Y3W2_9CHLO|nr:hypothetical protein HYH03_009548 [Edaphochlamys debaryana]|eukprot:KAG2492050.1 hypothetical protein HYH03_009548 [Edaphochlamys debaryana]
MSPDQFGRFYRFVFYLCREQGKRNIPMVLAVALWRLLMPGRFRLLERWCAFAAASTAHVVTEDTWRQVLDFSRIIHEDLSNYDAAGAWAVLLDEFVDDMRQSRRRGGDRGDRGSIGSQAELDRRMSGACGPSGLGHDPLLGGFGGAMGGMAGGYGGGGGPSMPPADLHAAAAAGIMSFMSSISPRCGSKRREPDVDVVTQQLSEMPLGGGGGSGDCAHIMPGVHPEAGGSHMSYGGAHPYGSLQRGGPADALAKRLCTERPGLQPVPLPPAHSAGADPQLPPNPHHPPPQHPHQQHPGHPHPGHPHVLLPLLGQAQPPHALLPGDPHPHALAPSGPGCMAEAAAQHAAAQHAAAQHAAAQHAAQQPAGGAMSCCSVGGGGGGLGSGPSSGAPSSNEPMSCSRGSVDSDGCHGPVGTATMEGLQDGAGSHPHLLQTPGSQLCPQQRRALKARRSGVSDIVRTAVSDALGF